MKTILIFLIVLSYLTVYSQDKDEMNVISGTELQGGIGSFGDPTLQHGMAFTMNGAIGRSSQPNVFTYDAFVINCRWVPGTNNIGQRIAINLGVSNWFNPALSTIYKDTVLTIEEKSKESKNANFAMAGLAYQAFSNRIPTSDDYNKIKDQLFELYSELSRAMADSNEIKVQEIKQLIAKLNWERVIKPKFRKPSLLLGGNFRLDDLSSETSIDVIDLFSTFAVGGNKFDFSTSLHYMQSLDKQLIINNALTGTVGLFFDLDDSPPLSTLGIILGVGQYDYIEKTRKIVIGDGDTVIIKDNPKTARYDLTISFSDIFRNSGPFGESIAFRYSYLDHKSTKPESQFNILFTTKFINSKKK